MSITTKHQSLSALVPVQIEYQYDNAQKLKTSYSLYSHGVRSYNHELFKNFSDAAISKKTALILTSVKDLKQVFEDPIQIKKVGLIAGNCFLNAVNTPVLIGDTRLKLYNNQLYVGGKGEEVSIQIIPIKENIVRLKVKEFNLQVNENYPYDIVLSPNSLAISDKSREEFYVDFYSNSITFKTQTKDGWRYVSYDWKNKNLKCVGVHLNSTTLNHYSFIPTFITQPRLQIGFDPTVHEIKYFNEVSDGYRQKTVELLSAIQMDTSLLVSLPSAKLTKNESKANISLLKTNFSNQGAFNPSI